MMMARNKEKRYSPKRNHSVGSWGQKRRVVCKGIAITWSKRRFALHATVMPSSQADGKMTPNKTEHNLA